MMTDRRLEETDGGRYRDVRRQVFDYKFPDFFNGDFMKRSYPEGESHHQMFRRVHSFIEEVRNLSRLVVCTHHGPLCAIADFFACPTVFREAMRTPLSLKVRHCDMLVSVESSSKHTTNRELYIYRLA
jgi:broad specificity phosphatase PhoE